MVNPRLRQSYDLRNSEEDGSQRLLYALMPGTKVDIHRHPVDEMLIVIRGAIKAILVDDDKNIIDEKVIRPADGVYGVLLPKNVWYFDKLCIDSLSNVWSLIPVCSR